MYYHKSEVSSLKESDVELFDFTANLKSFYHSIDCLIYYAEIPDTWGRVITEAMASRNYVIARNIGAAKEQINSEDIGMLVESSEELGAAMQEIVRRMPSKRPSPWFDISPLRADKIASYGRLRSLLDPLLLKVGMNRGSL